MVLIKKMEKQEPETKTINIQVAIGPDGGWYACGGSNETEEHSRESAFEFIPDSSYAGCHYVVVSAEVLPKPIKVNGESKIVGVTK
jgi:hypothetical protein